MVELQLLFQGPDNEIVTTVGSMSGFVFFPETRTDYLRIPVYIHIVTYI